MDDAGRYRSRIEGWARNPGPLDGSRSRITHLRDRIRSELVGRSTETTAEVSRVMLRIVRPSWDALRAIVTAEFGEHVVLPRWALRVPGERWPWPDAMATLFDDPYLAARHLLFYDTLMAETELQLPWVEVVSEHGQHLFYGDAAPRFVNSPWRRKFRLDEDGEGLRVERLDG
jgi:hypothetical protein